MRTVVVPVDLLESVLRAASRGHDDDQRVCNGCGAELYWKCSFTDEVTREDHKAGCPIVRAWWLLEQACLEGMESPRP